MNRAKPSPALAPALSFGLMLILYSISFTASASAATTITPLFSFSCPSGQLVTCPDGYAPNVLIQASDGNFYGAAELTTSGTSDPQGGTLFKITPTGQFTRLFTFSPDSQGNYVNGDLAATSLLEANDGFLYGTTGFGGTTNNGVLFRIGKDGKNFQVMHQFCSLANCADGSFPGVLVLGHDGRLYGTTFGGGSNAGCITGCGTIFRFIPGAGLTTLFSFDGSTAQGSGPGGLVQGTDGNLYGTAGSRIFKFTLSGNLSILVKLGDPSLLLFTGADSGLMQASNGKLYGGQSSYAVNQIQFFELSTSGTFVEFPKLGTLAVVTSVNTPIQATDGNLWTAFTSRTETNGAVVAFSPSTGAVVHDFQFNGANGSIPLGSVVQGADGKLYGTADGGGQVGRGTVWVLDAGLSAPKPVIAAFNPGTAAFGATVLIRGDHFIATTAVEFNGVAATFKVLNRNFISAVVPAGATTGPITVTNSGGSTQSHSSFTVN